MSKNGEKDKDKEKVEPDRSTPDPLNAIFTEWVERLFQDGERANFLVATQVFGRNKRDLGQVLRRHPFRAGEPEKGEIVRITNEFWLEMQEEADNTRQTRYFLIEALNDLKGGSFATKIVEVMPKKTGIVRRDGNGVIGGDGFDGEELSERDVLLARSKLIIHDAQWWGAHNAETAGGHIQLLVEQNKDFMIQLKEIMGLWMAAAKAREEALNNKVEREVILEREKLKIEMQRRGFNLLAGLIPGAVEKLTDGKVQLPGGRTTESIAIEQVMDGLESAEKLYIFGAWTDDGKRTQAGVLDEEQVRIIVGVMNDQRKPDEIEKLVDEKSAHVVTGSQFVAITQRVEMAKLVPLLEVIKKYKDRVDAAKNGAKAN